MKFIKNTILIFNLILALALVIVHYSASVNPVNYWFFSLLGLGYPILLLGNLFFVFFWLLRKTKWFSFFSLLAIFITWQSNKSVAQFSRNENSIDSISIMSWNVKNFDFYNWSGNENARQEMFELIANNRPNVLCLQEFYTENSGNFNNIKDLKNLLGYEHYYFAETYQLNNSRRWGLVIFSDFDIQEHGKVEFEEGTNLNSCMYVDLNLKEKGKLRVYNLHLQSNQFSKEDYDYLENIGEENVDDQKSVSQIVAKLKKGYINRAEQTLQVLAHKNNAPFQSIICGDFNDTPISFSYKTLSSGMKDAFIEKGKGFGKTFQNPTPFLRIDHVLLDPSIEVLAYQKIQAKLSDHYPIIVNFKMPSIVN